MLRSTAVLDEDNPLDAQRNASMYDNNLEPDQVRALENFKAARGNPQRHSEEMANVLQMLTVTTVLFTAFILVPLSVDGTQFHHSIGNISAHKTGELFCMFATLAFVFGGMALILLLFISFARGQLRSGDAFAYSTWYTTLAGFHLMGVICFFLYLCFAALGIAIVWGCFGLYDYRAGYTAVACISFVNIFIFVAVFLFYRFERRFYDEHKGRHIDSLFKRRTMASLPEMKDIMGSDADNVMQASYL